MDKQRGLKDLRRKLKWQRVNDEQMEKIIEATSKWIKANDIVCLQVKVKRYSFRELIEQVIPEFMNEENKIVFCEEKTYITKENFNFSISSWFATFENNVLQIYIQ